MSNPINPVLGHARLKSLLFEVIGQSEILSINLPIDPPFSAIKHSRQLLLRLKWTLDAFNLSCFDPAQVLTIQSLEGSTTLRILLRILKLCSSESVHGTPPADYQVWRYIALDTMVTAMQVLLLTKYEVSPDEEDLVLSAIQQVVRIWGEARPLSASEGALLEHILPGSIGANHEEDSRVQQIPLEEALDYVSASVMDSPSVSPESFWRLYNTVSQIIFRLGVDVGDAESSFNPVRAVSVVNAIIEKSTSASGHETSIAIVKHQIQRLSLAIAPVHHPSVEILLDQKLVKRMRTYIKLEMGDFQRMLLVRTVDTLSNARLWEEDRSFTISPASARSDDHPAPSSFTSTGSPLDQASIPSPLNHRDSTITILPANTARVLPVPIADHTLYREVNVSLDEPQRKELSLGTTIRERVQEQENTTQNEPNRDSNLSLSALLPPIRSSHCPRVHNPEDPLSVKVPSVTEKASWSPFANERSSLREAGRQLPVSTFIPSPKLEEVPEGGPSSHDEPEELSSPPFSTRPTISGLEIADTRSIRTTQRTMESTEVHMLDTPSLVLTPRIRTEPPGFKFHRSDDDSSTLRRRKSRLFNFMSRSEKSTPERLPHSLELSFSHCGRYLVMWCRKDATFIIRIEYPFRSGRRFQLDLPKERQSTDRNASNTSIRHLVCYGEAIAALIQIENAWWLFHLQSKSNTQTFLGLGEAALGVLALALSPNGMMIALGCGRFSLLYRVHSGELFGPQKLWHSKSPKASVCSQKLNFSVDSTRVVSCIQVGRSSQKHDLYVAIWVCDDEEFELERQLDPIELSVGFMDDKGISAAFFVSIQDTTPIQQIFLTLALTKPYPAILNLSRGVKYKHIDLPYTRIDGSAQCSSSSSNHFVVFRMLQSSRHKIYRIDTRTGATETITQFSAEHKSSKVGYEPVAMAMRDCDTVLAAWKSGDGAVSVERYTLVSGKWTTTTMDVANVYRQLATY